MEKLAPAAAAIAALTTLACCLPVAVAAGTATAGLAVYPRTPVRVFIVWEPILPTDFGAPTTSVLGRAPDPRVRQYWDKDHLLAKQMAAEARAPQPEPECCVRSGVLWDLAAVYAKGARWDAQLPAAPVFNGPVVHISEAIEAAIAGAK